MNHSESIGPGLPAFAHYVVPECFSGAVLTPELAADILGFRLSESLLSDGWWFFELVSESLIKGVAGLV